MDSTHTKPGHSHDHNAAVSHERGDIDILAVLKFGVGLAIATGIAALAMWGLFVWFKDFTNQERMKMPANMIEARKEMLPPQPRLQSMGSPMHADVLQGDLRKPSVELARFREEEARQLDSSKWVDPAKGLVQIPVEEAKELVLKQGLPVKIAPDGIRARKTANPGEGVGTSAAAMPVALGDTGAAAIGSAQVTTLHHGEEEKSEAGEKK